MQLIERRGGFLYQHRPDLVPHGWMTPDELALWVAYYEQQRAREGAHRG